MTAIPIEIIDGDDASWPVLHWPHVPRVGDVIELPDGDPDGSSGHYRVRTVVWHGSSIDDVHGSSLHRDRPESVTLVVDRLGTSWTDDGEGTNPIHLDPPRT